jgi:chemotaxis protein MotB
MARKPYNEDNENHERWLISYADFITLLFAFFVVMYAISVINEGKYKVLSVALGDAFGTRSNVSASANTPAIVDLQSAQLRRKAEAALREKERLGKLARDLSNALSPLVKQGKVRILETSRGISVEINASVLFAPGDATLHPEGIRPLRGIAVLMSIEPNAIEVEGHTDDQPIQNSQYPSNWELSAVRASTVVRLFVENGVPPARLTAVGHGANKPVADNTSAEGRSRNRRVAVNILAAEAQ